MAPTLASDSNSWDAISFAVNKGHGVKGLSDLGLQTLPDQYIQPPQEQITTSTIVSGESIPVIDLSNWDDPAVASSICDAAEKWGFFQIVNHGIPMEVLENVKKATHRFFQLPADVKNKHSKDNSSTNNVRYGTSFTPKAEKALEWKDFLSLFYVSDDEASSLWPSACRNETTEFIKRSDSVIRRLLQALMKGLGINEIDNAKEAMLMGSKRINLNYYPKCPEPQLTAGVGRHSDVSTLTFLLQDDVGGLYVKKLEKDEWVHVPPIDGAIVINVGDALQILSNGRYKSVEHRVMANGTKSRVSVPIFINPRPSDIIGPLPETLQGGDKAIYKKVLYSDYVKHFFRKAHNGKDTMDFAKI